MSKTEERGKVPQPPLDEDGNLIMVEDGSNTETTTATTLEALMRRLEKLTEEKKKLRTKAKNEKTKGCSSSSEEEDFSFEEDVSKKERKGKEEKIMISLPTSQYLLITIICLALPLILLYPLAKLPILMELVITNGSIARKITILYFTRGMPSCL
jgi:hypothetical protein